MSSPRREGEFHSSLATKWDHGTHEEFYRYYAQESANSRTMCRFQAIRDMIIRTSPNLIDRQPCQVADIGCGAGTQSMLWAKLGCDVHGVDVNEPLLQLARERAAEAGYSIEFVLGSAVSLPWPDESVDLCLAVELLEHVEDWRSCLQEFSRIVRPRGVLFLSTTNALCPAQKEFNLPFYSWYPRPVKQYCEKLAKTTRPQLANYAKYPAEHWFTFYQLRDFLKKEGFVSLDRFDLIDAGCKGLVTRGVLGLIRTFQVVRWLAHLATPGTSLMAIKSEKLS